MDEHRGHAEHAGHSAGDFLRKFSVAAVLCVPIFFYSEMARTVFGIQGPPFFGSEYLGITIGSAVFFYCGWLFLTGAYQELKNRRPGMMTLVALAITSAYIYSLGSLVLGTHHDLLLELSSLIAIMLLGHWMEMRSVKGAQDSLSELAKLLPDTAEVVRGGSKLKVPVGELTIGDAVLVKPGGKVPADGEIEEGQSDVDESIITGESKPVLKSKGMNVIAGSINGDGSLTVRVTTTGEGTFLAGVMRLVADAQSSKSRLQTLSDQAAFYLTLIAICAGGATFIIWLLADAGVATATERLVAVLVITCPHALGLAIPLVAAISTTLAARNGLLVRERRALESARAIDVVLLDKTGTLTKGAFAVTAFTSDDALALAAAVEKHSEHPIGKAIVAEAEKRGLSVEEAMEFTRVAGAGAAAIVSGKRIFVGHRGDDDIAVESEGKHIGSLRVADEVRPEAKEAIKTLKRMHLEVIMITGDSAEAARSVARELGIEDIFSRVRPEEKAEKVRLLQSGGKRVAMVGDGINDAPALTEADIGIAIGAGTNVAIESAGIILVRNDPRDIAKIFRLSRLTYRKMVQNLFWATGYNVVAIPLAAGVLAAQGIVLQPALAAIFMSASTVVVAFNALLLRRAVL